MIFLKGRFIYEVTSGRIVIGSKSYLKGKRIGLTLEQALSLGGDQLKFIKVLPSTSKTFRHAAPGETLLQMSDHEIARIAKADLIRMAQQEFGLIFGPKRQKSMVKIIMEAKHGILRSCRSRKDAAGQRPDQPVK